MANFSYIFLCALIFCCFGFLNAEDFISKSEYARMLFANPRGIGCDKCHGEKGDGKVISIYKIYDKATSKLQSKKLVAPRINNLGYEIFYKAVKNSSVEKTKNMMPRYFLTDNEILTLYDYLQSLNKDKK